MDKISIIVPAYNAQDTIERCVKSACGQSFENLEIIIVNDGSSDATADICNRLEEKDHRIQVIHTKNRGVSEARNTGIWAARGEFLFFLDADDFMEKDALASLLRHSQDMDWVIGNYRMVDVDRDLVYEHEMYFAKAVHVGTAGELWQLCCGRNFHCVWGKLYRRDIIREKGIWFDGLKDYGEDLLFNMDYFSFVKKFAILRQRIYTYCFRFGQGLGTRFIEHEWEIQKEFCADLAKRAEEVYGLSEKDRDRLNHFYFSQSVAVMERIAKEKSLKLKEKKRKIAEITGSPVFQSFVKKETSLGNIRFPDRILLRNGLVYIRVHEWYARLKNRKKGRRR